MAELSNLLGAVYGDAAAGERDPDGPPTPVEPAATARGAIASPARDRGPTVPAWADDEHLDAAFAGWTPGPAAEAHPVERAFVSDHPAAAKPLADDLAAALSEALVAADPHEERHAGPVDDEVEQADENDDDEEDAHVLPFQRRRAAAAELSATAGPLPSAPPPPADAAQEVHGDEPVPDTAAQSSPAVARTWARADDDILPARRRGFFSLSLRRG